MLAPVVLRAGSGVRRGLDPLAGGVAGCQARDRRARSARSCRPDDARDGGDQRHRPLPARTSLALREVRGLHQGAARRHETELDDEHCAHPEETAPYGTGPAAATPRPREEGAHPSPPGDEGARREVHDAHGLRAVRRGDLRRGRHRRAPGRRQRLQQRLRQRDLAAGHRRRADPADPRGLPVGAPRAGRRRPAVRLLPGLARAGLPHRRPVHEGGRRALRQARGRRRDGRPDRAADPRRHPGDGAHRLHPAVRARARRLPGPGPRRDLLPGCSPTPRRSRTPAPSPW